MKRILSFLFALLIMCSMTISASAESTTLTIEIPEASYMLNVPANQSIAHRATETSIGCVTVSNTSGFAVNQELWVSIYYDGQFSSMQGNSAINYSLACRELGGGIRYDLYSGYSIKFNTNSDGTLSAQPLLPDGTTIDELLILIDTIAWDNARSGTYTTTITFQASIC